MLNMMLVTLREGIEMFLIVAIAVTYLGKTGRAALLPAVAWGTGTAIAASVVLGTWLAEVAVLPKWESLLAPLAAGPLVFNGDFKLQTRNAIRPAIRQRPASRA